MQAFFGILESVMTNPISAPQTTLKSNGAEGLYLCGYDKL